MVVWVEWCAPVEAEVGALLFIATAWARAPAPAGEAVSAAPLLGAGNGAVSARLAELIWAASAAL